MRIISAIGIVLVVIALGWGVYLWRSSHMVIMPMTNAIAYELFQEKDQDATSTVPLDSVVIIQLPEGKYELPKVVDSFGHVQPLTQETYSGSFAFSFVVKATSTLSVSAHSLLNAQDFLLTLDIASST